MFTGSWFTRRRFYCYQRFIVKELNQLLTYQLNRISDLKLSRSVLEVVLGKVPVDKVVKESINKVGTTVLVIKVVSMLPNIKGNKGLSTMVNGGISIVSTHNLKLTSLVKNKPSPAGAEVSSSNGLELVLESIIRAKVSINSLGNGRASRGLRTTVGLHGLPEEGVVVVLSSVVKDALVTVLRRVKDDLIEGLVLVLKLLLNEVIKVSDVRLVMLTCEERSEQKRKTRLKTIDKEIYT